MCLCKNQKSDSIQRGKELEYGVDQRIFEWINKIESRKWPICGKSILSKGNLKALHKRVQLTCEQHGFELHTFTYTWIFFKNKYYSTTESIAFWICGCGIKDMGGSCKVTCGFLTAQGSAPSPPSCSRVNCTSSQLTASWCCLKGQHQASEKTAHRIEKNFVNRISDKGLIFRIHKKLLQFNSKKDK